MPRGRVLTNKTEYVECTFGDAREEFYNYNRVKGLAIDTQNAYRTYIEGFARWYGKDKKLSDISPKILEAYANKKIEDGNKPVSVATTMVHLKRFFRFCHSRNYIDEIEIVIPKYEIELKEPYTEEEMNLLLKRPKTNSWVEYRNWVMVNYFYSTGQRLSTVLHIKVKDLNLELQKVKLIWNKDKIQKWMPLSTSMVTILKEYIEISSLMEEDYLFPEYEGDRLKKRSAQDAIADYNKSRGVEKTSIHLFRHTFAKDFIMAGGNPVKLQKLLNHKTIEMSMKYVNLYDSDVSVDIDLFNPLDNYKRKNSGKKRRKTIESI